MLKGHGSRPRVRQAGNDDERERVIEMGRHWRALGYHVPVFAMGAEPPDGSVDAWRADVRNDLTAWPYNLVEWEI